MISQPLDSKTLPWLAIRATHTQGHPGTRHTVIRMEREEKRDENDRGGGGVDGRQKTKKALPLKKR